MLAELKFVQGAVAKKDFVPALTHFAIRNKKIMGYNGQIAICSPINLALEATPQAKTFIKAIQACGESIHFNVTPTNKLSIKSGKFKAFVQCVDNETYPTVEPSGQDLHTPPDFMDAITKLAPFVAEDASKPWSRGILFRGKSAFATNNIILVEYWLGEQFPFEVNIPAEAIDELLRIGEQPEKLMVDENSISFIYSGGRWLKTTLYSTEWPNVQRLFESANFKDLAPFPPSFFTMLKGLAPFVDKIDSVFFLPNEATTTLQEGEGASVDIEGVTWGGKYGLEHLLMLEPVAKKINFHGYPQPCPFVGEHVRGLIVGMKL